MAHQPKRSISSTTPTKKPAFPLTADYRVLSSAPPLQDQGAGLLQLPLETTEQVLLQLGLVRKAKLPSNFGPDPGRLTQKFHAQSSTRLCIEIESAHNQAWKVPHSIVPRLPPKHPYVRDPSHPSNYLLDYEVVWKDPNSFAFTVLRKSTGEKLFDTTLLGLTMKDQYLELSTHLLGGTSEGRTANLYGLGENVGPLRRTPGATTTLWARDSPCKPNTNLYGCHPFYMEILPSGSAHGVLLMSSNGMDIVFSPEGDKLTYKVVGGAIELHIFTGPTPQQVIQQYTELIGRPCMIPYYAQGFHMCRWGYDTLKKVKTVVSSFKENSLPLEAIWIDIDYMKDYMCFTFDEERFPANQLAEYVKELHTQNQHLVMILDPGIKVQYRPGLYEPYDEGVSKDLFIKRRITKLEEVEAGSRVREGDLVDFVGKVWPGKTTFPDWFHPETQPYWTKYITRWFHQVPLDGIWIDMNEAASFHDGDCSHIESSEDRPVRISDFAMAEPEDPESEGAEGQLIQPQHQQQPQHKESHTKKANVNSSGNNEESIQPKDVVAFVRLQVENNNGPKPPVVYTDPNEPPYRINNNNEHADLGYRTISPDALHHGGVTEYDVHNLYGHMEAIATYNALRELQPKRKPFILSRSTFPGSGRFACKWNGDNCSTASDMKASIAGFLNFQFFGISMTGADIGGFGGAASEELLIRWHQLGAFYPFMRNHNCRNNPPQEPYLYKRLTEITRSIDHGFPCIGAEADGCPCTISVGTVVRSGILEIYVQSKSKATQSKASQVFAIDAPLDKIPVHLRGGHILPRAGMEPGEIIQTTFQVRKAPIEILVALDDTECAHGEYYHDDDSFAPVDGTLVRFEARPGILFISSFAANGPIDDSRPEEGTPDHGSGLFVPRGGKELRPTWVQSVVVWGIGMDHVAPGRILAGDAKSSSQVESHQVRVSIVDAVGPTTQSLQRRRELRAVPSDEFMVEWNTAKSQLRIQFRKRGGLEVQGNQALEMYWT
ncbi:hypothetical protein BGZ65_003041 [Modicella reniformis]|uniref:Maltase n=1 Tax=Modicella reniformis TaxID=1440133 RepID=A0A9P6MI64_9FUNG|nr:hypothetical protein BGZ65_003041 [Modicella reniformis]